MDNNTISADEGLPLVDSSSSRKPLRNHSGDVHILSLAFLLVFSAYGAVQNLESTVNADGDLGTISLGVLYVSFAVFSLFASPVVQKLGSKCALVLGTTGYWLFTAANLKPNCHARDWNLHEGTVIGNFNGEFWGIYAVHQVIGNLLSLFLLSDGAEGSTSGTTVLFVVFLCIMTIGCILMCFLHRREVISKDQSNDSPKSCCSFVASVAKAVVTPLFDIRMLLIIPLLAYSGLQQAFVWSEFTKKIVKPALGEAGIGGSMAVYGAADAICSLVAGRLTSSLSSVTWIIAGGSSAQAIVLLWILLKYSTAGGVLGTIFPLFMAAGLGIGDGVLMTQINALLGMLFKHDMEGAFAQLKVWQAVSIAVLFFLTPFLSLHTMAIITLAALFISLGAFLILALTVEKARN